MEEDLLAKQNIAQMYKLPEGVIDVNTLPIFINFERLKSNFDRDLIHFTDLPLHRVMRSTQATVIKKHGSCANFY